MTRPDWYAPMLVLRARLLAARDEITSVQVIEQELRMREAQPGVESSAIMILLNASLEEVDGWIASADAQDVVDRLEEGE